VRRFCKPASGPKNPPLGRVRQIRDDVDRRVHELLAQFDEQDA
jgi:hypothetical protein